MNLTPEKPAPASDPVEFEVPGSRRSILAGATIAVGGRPFQPPLRRRDLDEAAR